MGEPHVFESAAKAGGGVGSEARRFKPWAWALGAAQPAVTPCLGEAGNRGVAPRFRTVVVRGWFDWRAWGLWMVGGLLIMSGLLPAQPTLASVYVVQPGDTLSRIARRHGVSLRELAQANDLDLTDQIRPGQKLRIPDRADSNAGLAEERTVVVRPGDHLASIARAHDVEPRDLALANGLTLNSVIYPGQRLVIPSGAVAAPVSPLPTRVQRALDRAPVRAGRWRHIVIHHSATDMGDPRSMDRYHRQVRNMENGLAYHFVIGNGRGMGDGEIAVGLRWTRQLPGGHLSSEALNQISLGICLVGDFNQKRPTRRQMESLEALVRALLKRCQLDKGAVTTHGRISPRHTECPGRLFPWKALVQALDS
ncbi:MAG: LysM peptidoglycan-binding domain-containing protein [Verrucomicrobiota bacterium]|nr:LysM peptidoglycan-binding domain-containing protein [Limisphaera sp.]MDW8381206.1 LysM peptidoglycan-binding domain-containing protein [Verrucomicrobiota bacterium]